MLYSEASLLPEWLVVDLPENCPYCNSPYHVGYSPNGLRVTKHYCPNRECSGTVATKMSFMWTVLGVDGIKFGKSLTLVKDRKLKRHLDAIPLIIKDKPNIDLATFMRICCIEGVDGAWENICKDKENIDEVLNTQFAQQNLSTKDAEDARDGVKYFDIFIHEKQDYTALVRMTIMMTGDIMGLPNRELLVSALNAKYKGLLDLRYSKSIRKTGIAVLVKESSSPVTGKVNTAKDCGIPIMTPEEFIKHVDKRVRERAGDRYDI